MSTASRPGNATGTGSGMLRGSAGEAVAGKQGRLGAGAGRSIGCEQVITTLRTHQKEPRRQYAALFGSAGPSGLPKPSTPPERERIERATPLGVAA
jgi:hypothetical protein